MIADYMLDKFVESLTALVVAWKWVAGIAGASFVLGLLAFIHEICKGD